MQRRGRGRDGGGLPRPDDPSFRVTCNEIADQLSKSWWFKLQIIGTVVLAIIVVAAAASGILGWNISASLQKARSDFQKDAQKEIGKARQGLEAEIAEQFKKENVQKTMEQAANKEAGALLKKSVEPSIKEFQQKLDKTGDDLDKRFAQFNELITTNEEKSSSNVENLRSELSRLQKRNNLAALADKAISNGDVDAYRQLEKLSGSADIDEQNAGLAELFRVYQAYSVFSGVNRSYNVHLVVEKINPKKAKEEDLDLEELFPLMKADEALARIRVAQLIAGKARAGSFKTAEAIVDVLKGEKHLEVFKILGNAFATVTGWKNEGKLDRRELFDWWEKNKDRLREQDTDKSPTPSPAPSK